MLLRRTTTRVTGHTSSVWPVLLVLAAAALIPSLCVLWFMHAAMQNEQLAMRQRLSELYRQHLMVVRDGIDKQWAKTRQDLLDAEKLPPRQGFRRVIEAGDAEAAILRSETGEVVYPTRDVGALAALSDIDVRAQALLAEARQRVAKKDVAGALKILKEQLTQPQFMAARNGSGRLIVPNALLYALSLAPGDAAVVAELSPRVGDYSGPAMPSSQRLMLLTELDRITQSTSPLRTGEELAAAYLELLPPPEEKHDQLYRVGRDIWALSPSGGRITALYRDATVTKLPELADLTPPAGTRVRLEPQVQPAAEPLAALPMGSLLPDFRLALYPIDPIAPVDSTRQASLYLWTAVAVLFLIAVATLLAGRYVAAQVRLAHLKNDLIATVSHELKTPLASMRVLLDTLIEGRATSPVQTSQYLWLIAGENHRLSRLIDNFLTFSRMERDRRAFEMSPIDPREVILGAYETIRERFEPPDQKLEIEVPATLPPIRGDRDALLTMLLNLLENAHKYTEPVKRVRLRAYNNNAHVYVEVTDNGIGIPRRSLDRIFDRFYQVDQNLSRKSGGCGLGLSIVRFILKAHGGDIHVSSTPGSGSTFTVRLPAVISSSSTQQRALAHAR